MDNTCPVCGSRVQPDDVACQTCGFKLLGSTQQFEPIAIEGDSSPSPRAAKAAQSATLTIIRGPQVDTVYTLDDKVSTIGRNPQCDIFLNDMTVSRTHATVFPQQGCFVIKDSSSYNGIWVNNQSVEERTLNDGDIIQIGTFCLRYNN